MEQVAAPPITIEPCEIEGETDLYALITVASEDGTVIEVQYDLSDLDNLIRQARGVSSSIVWHRAEWLHTANHGKSHLARKADRRVLCGSRREEWHFVPYFKGYYVGDVCKRCLALFEKAA